MENNLVIFGATGGIGVQLVEQSFEQGYSVSAFVRDSGTTAFSNKPINIMQGDVLNYDNVLQAINRHDVVVCALGASASDKTYLRTNGISNIIKAMNEKGAKRLICISALGVGDSKELLPWHYKNILVPLILKNVYKDHETQEGKITQSPLDWTIIRPSVLTNDSLTGSYQHGFKSSANLKLKISRSDVAHFVLSQIESKQYLQKSTCISN